jgi:hypothetical protein
MQLRRHSFIESCTNIAVGYTVNMIANFVIFPLWGWEITLKQNIEIGIIYTVVSLCRSYCLRRIFTRMTE